MEIQHLSTDSRGKFFIEEDGERTAWLTWSRGGENLIHLDYVEVIPRLRGGTLGKTMVKHAVAYARQKELKVHPVCPYIRSVIERDASLQDVLA